MKLAALQRLGIIIQLAVISAVLGFILGKVAAIEQYLVAYSQQQCQSQSVTTQTPGGYETTTTTECRSTGR